MRNSKIPKILGGITVIGALVSVGLSYPDTKEEIYILPFDAKPTLTDTANDDEIEDIFLAPGKDAGFGVY